MKGKSTKKVAIKYKRGTQKNLTKDQKEILRGMGMNIRKLRISKGYTIEALANKCDMEKANFIPIEKGITNLSTLTLYKIAKALEVKIDDFFR